MKHDVIGLNFICGQFGKNQSLLSQLTIAIFCCLQSLGLMTISASDVFTPTIRINEDLATLVVSIGGNVLHRGKRQQQAFGQRLRRIALHDQRPVQDDIFTKQPLVSISAEMVSVRPTPPGNPQDLAFKQVKLVFHIELNSLNTGLQPVISDLTVSYWDLFCWGINSTY
jgi:hypothetical protein